MGSQGMHKFAYVDPDNHENRIFIVYLVFKPFSTEIKQKKSNGVKQFSSSLERQKTSRYSCSGYIKSMSSQNIKIINIFSIKKKVKWTDILDKFFDYRKYVFLINSDEGSQ